MSPDVPDNTVAALEKMGHKIEKLSAMGGPANAMLIDDAGNVTAANENGPKGMVQI